MDSLLVTIAIPAYKPDFLDTAIKSAINQTYKNIEIIIVDDNPTDIVKNVVERFNDYRIKYYKNRINIGKNDPANNWNKCIEYAKGEFFSLLCDDDYYEPTFIEELVKLAQKYPKVNVFRSRVKIIDHNNKIINYYPAVPEWESCFDNIWHMVNDYRSQTISEFLYRKKILLNHNGFLHYPKAWCADRVSIYLFSIEEGIVTSNKILAGFRMSGLNISSLENKNIREKVRAQIMCTNEIEKILSHNNDINLTSIIITSRKKQEEHILTDYLAKSCIKDYLFLWNQRNTEVYRINNNLFLKAILKKIIYMIKRIIS